MLTAPKIGDYVLATKWNDGDPGDPWAIGIYAGIHSLGETQRHMVNNADGSTIRPNGFPLADRRADAQATLSKTPTPRTYRIDGNELKVIDVPVVDAAGLAEVQRCFVWRDQEFRSSTLSCGQMPEILTPRD